SYVLYFVPHIYGGIHLMQRQGLTLIIRIICRTIFIASYYTHLQWLHDMTYDDTRSRA
ncbi:hypothetical protein ACJX0J_013275, partial [Zea mays]